jgi:nucleotide-binding universal stress UspA family protein
MKLMMKLQGPVLVGTAFNAASAEALRQGFDLANDLGTSLIVCHVVPHLDTVNLLFPQLAARNAAHRQKLSDKAMAGIERQVETILGEIPANVTAVVDSGTPHAGLLAQVGRYECRCHRYRTWPNRGESGTTRGCADDDCPSF